MIKPLLSKLKLLKMLLLALSFSFSQYLGLCDESVQKNIFKRGYEEIRERKLIEILKKDRTWLKYELHCNVKTPAPLFFQNNLTCFYFCIPEVKQQDSTPQNDSTLGFKWIKKIAKYCVVIYS
jgi:hypothetical protein